MNVASMIIETWAECAKRKVEHYYEVHQEKYEVASNRNNPHSGGSRKLIGKRGAVNDKIDNRKVSHRKFLTFILSKQPLYIKFLT